MRCAAIQCRSRLAGCFTQPVLFGRVEGAYEGIWPYTNTHRYGRKHSGGRHAQEAFGQIEFLLTGIEDDRSRAHGIDESLELDDWRKACLAEALLFEEIETAMTLSRIDGKQDLTQEEKGDY